MAKLLKPLIILLLLLSIGALVLGSMLYSKREIVKGRTQKLENAVARIAGNLEYPDLNKTALQNYKEMDTQLNPLATAAKNKHEELVATTETLEQTRDTLQKTEKTLEIAQSDLDASRDEVAQLNDTASRKDTEIARLGNVISSLETEKRQLTDTINGLENEVEIAAATLNDMEIEYEQLNKAFEDCVADATARSGGAGGDEGIVAGDFEGRILVVNPEWNFVVINKGTEDEMRDNVVLLVHRDMQPIGKIRVNRVREKIAVAEIISSWDEQAVHPGDEVISPRSS